MQLGWCPRLGGGAAHRLQIARPRGGRVGWSCAFWRASVVLRRRWCQLSRAPLGSLWGLCGGREQRRCLCRRVSAARGAARCPLAQKAQWRVSSHSLSKNYQKYNFSCFLILHRLFNLFQNTIESFLKNSAVLFSMGCNRMSAIWIIFKMSYESRVASAVGSGSEEQLLRLI